MIVQFNNSIINGYDYENNGQLWRVCLSVSVELMNSFSHVRSAFASDVEKRDNLVSNNCGEKKKKKLYQTSSIATRIPENWFLQ
jgi:hypothetical protein